MKFLLEELSGSQKLQFGIVLLGIFFSFTYVLDVVKILTISLMCLIGGLKIIYHHEPTKKLLIQGASNLFEQFSNLVGAYCIRYASGQELQEITTNVLKITAGLHRISKTWSETPHSPAVIDAKYLNIPFNFQNKQWELKVPFNKIHTRSPERPYIQYITGERFEFPNHHPGLEFYYTDLSEAAAECTYGRE